MSRQNVKQPPAAPQPTRYEDDFYTWIGEQIALLKAGNLSDIDALNIAEELSDVGNEQRDKLESFIAVLAQHLLKWDYLQNRRSRSWVLTIREQRRRLARHLQKNPGLKSVLEEALAAGYADGRDRALDETGLTEGALPAVNPYSFDELMTRVVKFDDITSP